MDLALVQPVISAFLLLVLVELTGVVAEEEMVAGNDLTYLCRLWSWSPAGAADPLRTAFPSLVLQAMLCYTRHVINRLHAGWHCTLHMLLPAFRDCSNHCNSSPFANSREH